MPNKKYYLINEKIEFPELRIIDGDGENQGVLSLEDARKLALESDKDLVVVSEKAQPPVARILEFKHFLRQQKEQELKSQRKSRQDLKQLHFGPNIAEHDLGVRIRRTRKFIEQGDKVKFTIQFRGRMIAHKEIGRGKLQRIIAETAEIADVEKDIWFEGKQMMLIIRPK